MLSCEGILRIPDLLTHGRHPLTCSSSIVTGNGHSIWRPKFSRPKFSQIADWTAPIKCANEGLQTETELKPKRTRARKKAKVSDEVAEIPPMANEGVHGGALDHAKEGFLKPVSITIPLGNREIVIETGLIGRSANGAVTVTDGETIIYTTACSAFDPTDPSDFAPLTVNYQERFSAAGRTSGGFIKREGRTRDHEILVCRLIDRPIRPLISKSFNFEVQILSWVLSYDGINAPEPLAITAAGAALAISDIPISKAVAGVRVGLVNDEFIVNPTIQEMAVSSLDMVIAGTSDAVLMIEGYCDLLTEEKLLQAVDIGQSAVSAACKEIEKFAAAVGKPQKLSGRHFPPSGLESLVEELVGDDLKKALQIKTKKDRGQAIAVVEEKLMRILTTEGVNTEQVTVVEDQQDEFVWNEDDDGMLLLDDGEVDEGDIHLRRDLEKPAKEEFIAA